MKASTVSYVKLQNIYKAKAREDVETFKQCLKEVLQTAGLDEAAVDEEEVEVFVRNCSGLTVLRGKNLKESLTVNLRKEDIGE
jgi:amyloid beta precursor protein binding protein 1